MTMWQRRGPLDEQLPINLASPKTGSQLLINAKVDFISVVDVPKREALAFRSILGLVTKRNSEEMCGMFNMSGIHVRLLVDIRHPIKLPPNKPSRTWKDRHETSNHNQGIRNRHPHLKIDLHAGTLAFPLLTLSKAVPGRYVCVSVSVCVLVCLCLFVCGCVACCVVCASVRLCLWWVTHLGSWQLPRTAFRQAGSHQPCPLSVLHFNFSEPRNATRTYRRRAPNRRNAQRASREPLLQPAVHHTLEGANLLFHLQQRVLGTHWWQPVACDVSLYPFQAGLRDAGETPWGIPYNDHF